MTDSNHQRILERISKCLAMAKSSNPHEAAIAWKQAKALMAAHNIGRTDVIASAASTSRCDLGVRPATWMIKLANSCARAFSCQVITERDVRKEAVILGIGNNPEFAAYTFEVLYRQLHADRKRFVSALSARFRLSSKRRQGDIFSEQWVTSVGAVIAKFAECDPETEEIITAYIEKNYPEIVTTTLEPRKILKGDYRAVTAGRNAGANAKIHRAMGQDKRLALEEFIQ